MLLVAVCCLVFSIGFSFGYGLFWMLRGLLTCQYRWPRTEINEFLERMEADLETGRERGHEDLIHDPSRPEREKHNAPANSSHTNQYQQEALMSMNHGVRSEDQVDGMSEPYEAPPPYLPK